MSHRTDLMQRLMLLRHDPDLVDELRIEAMKGDVDAQFGLGLVYAEGRGVEQDEVEAYAWLTVAMLQGDADAEDLRDAIMRNLSPAATHEAAKLAGEYVALIELPPARH